MVPLEDVRLLSPEELGQLSVFEEVEDLGAGLLMECEGYCGS